MLNFYRYMVEKGLKRLEDVPEPYQSLLREELEGSE